MSQIKDVIIICPTKRIAVMTWERFICLYGQAIKSYNKAKMTITMKNGQKMILVSSQLGRNMIVGDPRDFLTISLEEFETMLSRKIEERLNEPEQTEE